MNWRKGRVFLRALCGACICAVIILFSACTPQINNHGNFPNKDLIKSLKVGKSNKIEVNRILGPPSAAATFDKEAWYYVGSQASKRAFLDPKLLDRHILIIHFDEKGIVQKIKRLSKGDGRAVRIVTRKTPTSGKELTILEQLIGNIGRFDNEESKTGGAR